jgi:ATP-binding cassette, subfamily B, bacterial PglK
MHKIILLLQSCFKLLNSKEKYKVILFSFLSFLGSILEMIALIGIMPFVTFILEPEIVTSHYIYSSIINITGEIKNDHLMFLFAGMSVFILIFSLLTNLIIKNRTRIFVVNCQNRLAKEIIKEIAKIKYSWFSSFNPSEKANHIKTDLAMWGNNGILKFIQMIGTCTLFLISTLIMIFITPLTGIIGIALVIFFSLFVVSLTRNQILKTSEKIRDNNAQSLLALIYFFSAIKEIKISNKENFFSDRFLKIFNQFGFNNAHLFFFQSLPSSLIIIFGQVAILLNAIALWYSGYSGGEIATQMSFVILLIARVVPNANRFIAELNSILAAKPHIESIFKQKDEIDKLRNENINKKNIKKIRWSDITFSNVFFSYKSNKKMILNNISFNLKKGKIYGFVGKSGEGKSTLIDLLMGILSPTTGSIRLDDTEFNDINIYHWWDQIGYVPQTPSIINGTLRQNIAFGLKNSEVNDKRVWKCLSLAQLDEFKYNLTDGLDTNLSEQGVNLSGGQVQRIAIARAFYNKPKILILDEATSAIDTINEKKLQATITKIKENTTIFLIAHRMSTIKICDEIIVLDKGKIDNIGNFNYLQKKSKIFTKLTWEFKNLNK